MIVPKLLAVAATLYAIQQLDVLVGAQNAAPAKTEWYIEQVGESYCVPVKNINAELHYASSIGPFTTPEEVIHAIGRPAVLFTPSEARDHIQAYMTPTPEGTTYISTFITNQETCRQAVQEAKSRAR